MMKKIDAFNLKFLDGLDETLRGLFSAEGTGTGGGGGGGGGLSLHDDPFSLLSSPDDLASGGASVASIGSIGGGGVAAAASAHSSSGSGSGIGGGVFPLFEDVLSGQGLLYLHQFLSDTACCQTDLSLLLFWLDVQEFQRMPSLTQTMQVDLMQRQAAQLYDAYVRQGGVGASDQVGLPAHTVAGLLLALEKPPAPSHLMFNAAQQHVEDILRQEVYVRFLVSEYATRMKADVAAQDINEEEVH